MAMEKSQPKKFIAIILVCTIIAISSGSIIWYYSSKDVVIDIFPPEKSPSNITVKMNGEIIYQKQYVRNASSQTPHPFLDTIKKTISGISFEIYVEESCSNKHQHSQFSILDGNCIQIIIRENITFNQLKERPQYE